MQLQVDVVYMWLIPHSSHIQALPIDEYGRQMERPWAGSSRASRSTLSLMQPGVTWEEPFYKNCLFVCLFDVHS